MTRRQTTAVLTIDIDALVRNWKKLRARVAPARCAAVVKADAYGIGVDRAVPALARAGCRTFFVTHVAEGIRVRALLGDASAQVYVLNGLLPFADIAADYIAHGLAPVLGSIEEMQRWAREAQGLSAALHVETGMNRLGLSGFGNADALARAVQQAGDSLKLDFVMSHFISAERPEDPLNQQQIQAFHSIRSALPALPGSLANSSGIFLPQNPFCNLVRPGYALYGGNPTPGHPNPMEVVISLHADILQARWVGAGETVGYNGIWKAPRPSRIATLAVGYADGFPRGAAIGGGEAVVAGVYCPIVGRVSMDLMVLDVTSVPEAAAVSGVPVELLGHYISIDDLAARSGVIGYEILTGLGRRYHRIYVGG